MYSPTSPRLSSDYGHLEGLVSNKIIQYQKVGVYDFSVYILSVISAHHLQ